MTLAGLNSYHVGTMASKKNSSTFEKRRKELARKEKQKQKGERLAQRKLERGQRPVEDPLAGIVPGPQPRDDED